MRSRKPKKSQKSINKIEEDLPSFLLNLKGVPEDIDIPPRPKKSESYLGPVFFGECLQLHPPHSSVPLSNFHHVQIFVPSEEVILKDLLLPKSVPIKKCYESKTLHPVIQRRKVFADPFPHKCPGVRRIFAPDVHLSEGLGETKSIIEGETSREIPFYRVKKVLSACNPEISKTEVEIVTLSDIREEKWLSMSHRERMAHAHFPKEFVTLRVIGPTIPEAITITKLPSKRQTSFEVDVHLKSKTLKTSNKKAEKGKEISKEKAVVTEKEKEKSKESDFNLLLRKESSVEEGADSGSKRQGSEELEEGSGHQSSEIIRDKGEGEEQDLEEEAGDGEAEKENSQVFVNEEKGGSLLDAEEENPHEPDEG